jgi:DNA replication and repair protein RecF
LIIEQLNIKNHRNLKNIYLQPHPRFNVILGENGQGKTNLLSAIYLLATLKPLRARNLKELVTWGENQSLVEGKIERAGLSHALKVEINQGKKHYYRENKTCSQLNQYFGALSVVCFTPDDLDLVKGTPEGRRNFLDRAVFNALPHHLNVVLHFQKALNSKNRLLKENQPDSLIDPFDHTLSIHAAQLMLHRMILVQRLKMSFEQSFMQMMGIPAQIVYKPSITLDDEWTLENLQKKIYQVYVQHRSHDRQRGFTQKGPHADDLEILLQNQSAKSFASQGQQRALVLSLKIAEIEMISKAQSQNQRPVLLLDDISSELDPQRNQQLFNYLSRFDGQVFITSTQQNFQLDIGSSDLFKLKNGQMIP